MVIFEVHVHHFLNSLGMCVICIWQEMLCFYKATCSSNLCLTMVTTQGSAVVPHGEPAGHVPWLISSSSVYSVPLPFTACCTLQAMSRYLAF